MKSKTSFVPSRQEFFFIAALLIVIVAALFLNFLIFPQYNHYAMEREYYRLQRQRMDDLAADNQMLETLELQAQEVEAEIARLHTAVPEYSDEENALAALFGAGSKSGLSITGIIFDAPMRSDSEGFASVMSGAASNVPVFDADTADIRVDFRIMNVSYSGSYDELYNFIVDIQRGGNFFIRSFRAVGGENGALSGTISILLAAAGSADDTAEFQYYGGSKQIGANPFEASASLVNDD